MIDWAALEQYRESGIPFDVLEPILMQEGQGALSELAERGFHGVETPKAQHKDLERAGDDEEFSNPLDDLLNG
jgi:hypothetical protein